MTQRNIAYNGNIINMSTLTHALLLVVPRPSLPPRRPTLPKPNLPRPSLPTPLYTLKTDGRQVNKLYSRGVPAQRAMTSVFSINETEPCDRQPVSQSVQVVELRVPMIYTCLSGAPVRHVTTQP